MTPALKAMVEAMAAELERQADKGGSEPHFARLPGLHETHYFSGNLDLEKVARAGLEAIREPTRDLPVTPDGFVRVVAGLDHPSDPDYPNEDGAVEGDAEALANLISTARHIVRRPDAILTPTTGEANG